ncbi:MAG: hypothetical protein AVDCRST_MAG08-341 [uncultured Acetobacteraceae bacterium]|uniref:Uncharacterized protein n=1 Tax=uncultured Acetobacteraceae bacterium TaxID=169975 RepID=A0A6J4H4I4_9PROT|nr:MAG: hypothetical protein AVDCRST_MAG08-341 [uncultured Acetobacteraceae bacterium]
MFGLTRTLFGKMRYRRRWGRLAAAAIAAADSATADLDRRRRSWSGKRQPAAQATDGRQGASPRFPASEE